MGSIEARLWGGPKCGENLVLDTGVYGNLPKELTFLGPPAPLNLEEEVLGCERSEDELLQQTKLVYVRLDGRSNDGKIIYAYEPYVSHGAT